jgi:hypothetical protein
MDMEEAAAEQLQDDIENAVVDKYESGLQDMREIENYEPRR